MRNPILLIAANLVRQLRWSLLVLLGLMGFIAGVIAADSGPPAENVDFLIHQQAIYAVVVGIFTASSAIFNERKSRRILGVLAKGIERSEYVAGILLGVTFVNVVYCLSLGLAAACLAFTSGLAMVPLFKVVMLLVAASTLSACVSLFFSTLLHPLFAVASTGLFFGVSMAGPVVLGSWAAYLFPASKLAASIASFSIYLDWTPDWSFPCAALLESLLFWQVAAFAFSRRDITTPIE